MQRSHLARTSVLLLGLLVGAGTVLAGDGGGGGIISGRAVDTSTGRPLADVVVTVAPAGVRVRTGSDGRYVLGGVTPGTYTVTCSKPGYTESVTARVRIKAGATARHDCRMSSRSKRKSAAAEAAPAPVRDQKVNAGRVGVRRRPAVATGTAQVAGGPSWQPPQPALDSGGNREGYEVRDENPFVGTTVEPLSTFSIDVDTAGYANLRRFLERERRLPPRDAVKIEEMVNYFPYDYAAPTGNAPFAVHTEIARAPWNPEHRLVRIGLQGKRIATDKLPPANLVFLIDVSGSMFSADKLPLLKNALSLLVHEMRPRDRVAIVVYAGAAGLVLPSTPGTRKDKILAALDGLQAGGSTAGSAGIQLAYKVARDNFIRGGNNRVILATDGDFNVGPSSDAELVRLIEEKRKQGVFLTVLGFGTGNYQDAKMEKLADKGNGNHAYIDSLLEARKVLVSEMGGTLFTIAKDVKLQIEFNPALVKGYRLIGYENRMLRAQDFNDDKKDAGELGAGHSVTAFYEIIPAGSKEKVAGVDDLKYQKVQTTAAASSGELMTVKLRYKAPQGQKSKLIVHPVADRKVAASEASRDFRFASAVVELGLLLRNSKHKGKASYDALIARARGARGADKGGYRAAFIELAEKARALAGGGAKIAR